MSASGRQMDLRTSAAEAVTNQLRRELLDGTIAAGARILPKDLAERFAVSVVPVREALRRLEAENLIVTSPQRATYATDVGLEDLAGVYELRRILEAELAHRATNVATEEYRERCRSALSALLEAEPHSLEFFEAHRTFHLGLLAPAASAVALRTLEGLWQSVDRYMALAVRRLPEFSSSDYMATFYAEHTSLASAFETGDGAFLREMLVAHLANSEDSLRRAYQVLLPDSPATSQWLPKR